MTADEIKNYLEYALALEKKSFVFTGRTRCQLRIKRSNGKSNVLLRKKIQLKYRYEHVRFAFVVYIKKELCHGNIVPFFQY